MLRRSMRLLTRKQNRDQCSCLCSAVSTQQDVQTTRISAAALQQNFSLITDSERQHILNVYNQILPFICKQEREMKHAAETGALDTIFDDILKTYWHRITVIEEVIRESSEQLSRIDAKLMKVKSKPTQSEGESSTDAEPLTSFNTFMLKLRKSTTARYYDSQAAHYMQFGQPLVVDCGFESDNLYKARRSKLSYVNQIGQLVSKNLMKAGDFEPFNLHMCNVSEDSVLLQGAGNWEISRRMNHTSKCYTEIYDKSDLVMLSPDAPLYMEEYDPQKIYIIGGIVDLAENETSTLNKARKLGIECRRLPLDVYREWGTGNNKRLPLPSILKILQELRRSGDWNKALDAGIPRRFSKRNEEQSDFMQNVLEIKAKGHKKMLAVQKKKVDNSKKHAKLKSFW